MAFTLEGFDNQISKNVATADVSSDPNAAIYKGLESFGSDIATIGQQLYEKQRQQEVANDSYEDYRNLRIESEKFDTEWSNKAAKGVYKIDGKSYEVAKKDFLTDYTTSVRNKHSKDVAKYEAFKNISREYVTNSMVNAITEGNKQRLNSTVYNSDLKTKKFLDDVTLYTSDDFISKMYNEGIALNNEIYETASPYSVSVAETLREKFLRDGGLATAKQTQTMLLNGEDPLKIMNSFVPIESFFDKEKMGYKFKFLKDEYTTPEDVLEAKQETLRISANALISMKNKAMQDPSFDKEVVASLDSKIKVIQNNIDSMSLEMPELDVDYAYTLTDKEKLLAQKMRVGNKDLTMFFKGMTTAEQQGYIQDMLKVSLQGKKINSSTVDRMISDTFNAMVGTLDKSKFKNRDELIGYSYSQLKNIYNDPSMRATKDSYMWAVTFKKMGLARALHEALKNPVGFYANDPRGFKKAVQAEGERYIVETMGEEGLNIIKSNPTLGGQDFTNFEESQLKQYYSMRKQMLADGGPLKSAIVYNVGGAANMAKNLFDKNGLLNANSVYKLNAITDSLKATYGAIGSDNGEILKTTVAKEIDSNITRLRISGADIPAYYSLTIKGFKNPEFAGQMVDSLVRQGKLTREEGDTILVGHLGGINLDPDMRAEAKTFEVANRPDVVKRNNETIANILGQEKLQAIGPKVTQKVQQILKPSIVNSEYLNATISTVTNLVKQEYSKDTSRSLETVTDLVVDKLITQRIVPVESNSARGIFKKINPDENSTQLGIKIDGMVYGISDKLLKGKLEINMDQFKEFTDVYTSNRVFDKAEVRKAFVNSYTIRAKAKDVAGGGREVQYVAVDKTGKERYLADKSGKLITEVIP
jgi:hypothetical protein